MPLIKTILRVLVGLTFITSAILKLASLENFIIYTYSMGFFSYAITTILARILIVLEFLIGVGLVFKIFYRTTWWTAIITLIAFSLFLVYVAIFRNDDNCHCFGDYFEIKAIPSIIKNIILFLILLFVRKDSECNHPIKPYIVTVSTLCIIFVAFLGYPPNSLYSLIYTDKEERFNMEAYERHITMLSAEQHIVDSSRNEIIGFVSATCSHCTAGNKIIQAIFERNDLDKTRFKNCIMTPKDSLINTYKENTGTTEYLYFKTRPSVLIEINYGHFPTYVFLRNGVPTKAVNYKELNENDIVSFLKE